jgi:hypothetical protein
MLYRDAELIGGVWHFCDSCTLTLRKRVRSTDFWDRLAFFSLLV